MGDFLTYLGLTLVVCLSPMFIILGVHFLELKDKKEEK